MNKIMLMSLIGGVLIIFTNFFDLGFIMLVLSNALMLTGSYLNIKSDEPIIDKDKKQDV